MHESCLWNESAKCRVLIHSTRPWSGGECIYSGDSKGSHNGSPFRNINFRHQTYQWQNYTIKDEGEHSSHELPDKEEVIYHI